MINSIIPKFLFNGEDIIYLKDMGVQIQEGESIIGQYKVPCFKFLNLSESEVFDILEKNTLNEDVNDSQKLSYVNRVASVLFIRIRQAAAFKDKEQKIMASSILLSAVNSLACLNVSYANRFINLIRAMA